MNLVMFGVSYVMEGGVLPVQGSHRGKRWCNIVAECFIDKEQLFCRFLFRHD